ncbi:MAG TPA: CBS domain-containing protein [Gammaproteobacteria bacterium]|nr:CBS domain-containing protein [Gammaproteobacteria bacterium]
MILGDIMTPAVVTIGMDDPLRVASDIFKRTRFHHLLVVESNTLYGVLSDRDLLKAMSPNIGTAAETARDIATLNKRVHQVMSRKPITLEPNATIADAVAIFQTHAVSCIPIVDEERHPVGILSWRDLLGAMAA